MTQQQLRELIKASNPVSTPARLLPHDRDVRTLFEEVMHRTGNPQPSADPLEQPVERRRNMQTQEKPIQIVREQAAPRQRRRLIPALAGAMAVLVIGAGVWGLTRNTEPDVAFGSPIEATDVFNADVVTANWAGGGEYYTADATFQFIFVDGQSPAIRFSDELPESAGVPDWDGDGTVTELDGFIGNGADVYAGGTTTLLTCSQLDAVTAVCDEVREGFAFKNPAHSATWTFTIADGRIDSIVIEIMGEGTDPAALRTYGAWVEQNRPEVAGDLINEFTGAWRLTPDTMETHRQLVAEWVAQR
ncbi:MAG: hypothetical protein HKO63_09985 [Acidimicrobiia bacterium]|nr:hypothetical protein [Acidimicrobiia bacterium]